MFSVYSVHGLKLGDVETLEAGIVWEQAYYVYKDGALVWRKEELKLETDYAG